MEEASGPSGARGDHFCGLEKVQETSPDHLGVKRAWQMWIFLLVAKSVAGFLQSLNGKTNIQLESWDPTLAVLWHGELGKYIMLVPLGLTSASVLAGWNSTEVVRV